MRGLTDVAGTALGSVFGALASLRGTKPLHPRGSVHSAALVRTGVARPWEVAWLDEPGTDRGIVRLSRSIGLPEGWPDVLGLAFRFTDGSGDHDLLLASTATAPVLRHALLPRADAMGTSYSSSFTYSTPHGPAVIAADPRGDRAFTLKVASPWGSWQEFGVLALGEDEGDPPVALDAVRNSLPGLSMSPLLARLREPSYARARAHRSDSWTSSSPPVEA
jgi:hypothetical protein